MPKEKIKHELEEITGVGPTTIEKLESAGLGTKMSLAVSSPVEVSTVAGLSENAARKIIKECRDKLKLGFEVAEDYAKKRDSINKISTGCSSFDSILDGGFESGCITELFGQYGCLSGDTIIRINRCEKGQTIRLDRMYDQLHNRDNIPEQKRWMLDKPTYVRSFDGYRIGRHKIIDVIYSGEKEVYKITLENGNNIKATEDHKILTDKGWIMTKDLTSEHYVMCDTPNSRKNTNDLKANTNSDFCLYKTKYHPVVNGCNNKRLEIHRAIYEAYINNLSLQDYMNIIQNDEDGAMKLKYVDTNNYVIHHIDHDHYNNDISNLQIMTKEEHLKHHGKDMFKNFNQGVPEFSRVDSVMKQGVEKTYDIICEEPHHNFNAGDMIVHNCGKTQISHLIVVRSLMDDPNSKAIYIDTEGTFRADRIRDFAVANGLDPDETLRRIFITRAYNSDHQSLLTEEAERLIQKDNTYRVVVVDSLTSHFRSEFIGRGELATRQQKLNKHMHLLSKIAYMYNTVVLVTNQVMSSPAGFFGDPTQAVGGHIVGHNSAFRVYLRPGKQKSVFAKLMDSPNLPNLECNYFITKDGLEDA